ncbi:MAG: hypothetical protein ABEI77_05765 [Halorientalis sp.]
MHSARSSGPNARPTRRTLLRNLSVLGTVGALAGCSSTESSAASSPDGTDESSGSAGSTTTPSASGGRAASFDCGTIPTSLSTFESGDIDFSFTFDAPPQPEYALDTADDPVERVAQFYFARDGDASINNWDFNIEVAESASTYGDPGNVYPKATRVFQIEYGTAAVPVRHQAITDDQDVWVLELPQNGEFRVVRVVSAIMPTQFGCDDTVHTIARNIVNSIQNR